MWASSDDGSVFLRSLTLLQQKEGRAIAPPVTEEYLHRSEPCPRRAPPPATARLVAALAPTVSVVQTFIWDKSVIQRWMGGGRTIDNRFWCWPYSFHSYYFQVRVSTARSPTSIYLSIQQTLSRSSKLLLGSNSRALCPRCLEGGAE